MKYHLFAGASYYPNGGMADHQGAFATLAGAKAFAEAARPTNDRESGRPVAWAQVVRAEPDGRLVAVSEGDRDEDWRKPAQPLVWEDAP